MKFLIFTFLCTALSLFSLAQQDSTFFEEETPEKKKGFLIHPNMYYGGYLNVQLGTYTSIGATPMVAYKFTPKFSVGTQFTYNFDSYKDYGERMNYNNFGISIFSRYRIIPQFYLHTEYQNLNYDFGFSYGSERRRLWVPFLFVGGGYSQPVSENVWFNAQVLFDVLQNEKSPYANWEPFYRVGFGVGF